MSSLLLGLLLPLVLLFLMLVMERIERPLWVDSMSEQLESFLDTALPDEVERFVTDGYNSALEHYWRTRRPAAAPKARGHEGTSIPSSKGTQSPTGEPPPSPPVLLAGIVAPVAAAAPT